MSSNRAASASLRTRRASQPPSQASYFERVRPSTWHRRVIDESESREDRRRLLPAVMTLYLCLALWLWRDASYRAVWCKLADAAAFSQGPGQRGAGLGRSGPGGVLDREGARAAGARAARAAVRRDRQPARDGETPGSWRRGYRLTSVDGAGFDLPDTAHLITILALTIQRTAAHILAWSRWRRRKRRPPDKATTAATSQNHEPHESRMEY